MKKRILSLMLSLALVVSLFAGIGLTASAEDTEIIWATGVTTDGAKVKGISDTGSNFRYIAENSLGEPDAYKYASATSDLDNSKITATRYWPSLTYTFGSEISNVDGYDLALAEATVGSWHPEALEITLIGINGTDDDLVIGTAYNNIGVYMIDAGLITEQLNQEVFVDGFYTITRIFFPDNVATAKAVVVRDVTSDVNEMLAASGSWPTNYKLADGYIYKASTYTAKKDGFDLDAIGAFTEEITKYTNIAVMKFLDINDDATFDIAGDIPWNDSFPTVTMDLKKLNNDGTAYDLVGTVDVDKTGTALFLHVEDGEYLVTERSVSGYKQTTPDVYVTVIAGEAFYSTNSAFILDAAAIGNTPVGGLSVKKEIQLKLLKDDPDGENGDKIVVGSSTIDPKDESFKTLPFSFILYDEGGNIVEEFVLHNGDTKSFDGLALGEYTLEEAEFVWTWNNGNPLGSYTFPSQITKITVAEGNTSDSNQSVVTNVFEVLIIS